MEESNGFDITINFGVEEEEEIFRGTVRVSGRLLPDELGAEIIIDATTPLGDVRMEFEIGENGVGAPWMTITGGDPGSALLLCLGVRVGPHVLQELWECYGKMRQENAKRGNWRKYLGCVQSKAWDIGWLALRGIKRCALDITFQN